MSMWREGGGDRERRDKGKRAKEEQRTTARERARRGQAASYVITGCCQVTVRMEIRQNNKDPWQLCEGSFLGRFSVEKNC